MSLYKLQSTIVTNKERLLDLNLVAKLAKERFKKNLDFEQSRLQYETILQKSSQKHRDMDIEQFKMVIRMYPEMYG